MNKIYNLAKFIMAGIKDVYGFFKQAHSEDNGRASHIRLNSTFATVQFATVITWGFYKIVSDVKYKELIIPYLTILSSLLAGLLVIKLGQKIVERKKAKEENTDETISEK